MLVITRKKGESLLIGDDIEIEVLKLENGSVKLAINAPKSIRILRKELYVEVTNENKEAISFDLEILKKIKK
ncbi:MULTISPECIES: carbon storage regulator CsrA [Clostridium]|uniref:Translational regulator CsrA n=1 Tax=Clostridium paridis TaxID=2803863 RepID=A0A937FFK1_9CLOT|nr:MULTISPECIES: carbon storage regulator CsrA [Clostridium]MBL4932904.1 carbon storage regulator CsrA [Clostridium paridis]